MSDKPKSGISWIHSSLDEAGLNPFEMRVYVHVCRRAGENGQCFGSVRGNRSDVRHGPEDSQALSARIGAPKNADRERANRRDNNL
jgi:hypothetical protein